MSSTARMFFCWLPLTLVLKKFKSIPILLSKKLRNLFNITLAILAVFDAIYTFSDLLESLRMVHYSHTTCTEVPFYQQMHLNLVPILSMINGASMMASIYTTIIIQVTLFQKTQILFFNGALRYLIQRISNQFYKCEPNFSKYSSERDSWESCTYLIGIVRLYYSLQTWVICSNHVS